MLTPSMQRKPLCQRASSPPVTCMRHAASAPLRTQPSFLGSFCRKCGTPTDVDKHGVQGSSWTAAGACRAGYITPKT